jgi:glycerophosphoryl diester phosphodiesterase
MSKRIKNGHWIISRPIAHRGLHNNPDIPENSMMAFGKAIKANHPIELDVQLTKDKRVVVFHDDNASRMTGVNSVVSNSTYDDIKKLKLLETDQSIPSLNDVLKIVDGQVPLLIEIKTQAKSGIIEILVYEALKKYQGDYAIHSFDPRIVYWFKKNAPEILRGYVSGPLKDEKMNFLKRWFLSNLIAVYFIKPDFIAYDIVGIDKLCLKIFKKMSKKPFLAWVYKDINRPIPLKVDNIIFEDCY